MEEGGLQATTARPANCKKQTIYEGKTGGV
jgi:hypothetical protein